MKLPVSFLDERIFWEYTRRDFISMGRYVFAVGSGGAMAMAVGNGSLPTAAVALLSAYFAGLISGLLMRLGK